MLNSLFFSFKNKKAQGLSIETIIVIIILIIVLLVVIIIFTDQSSSIFETIKRFLGIAEQTTPRNLTGVIS